jgi:hypothetical protein
MGNNIAIYKRKLLIRSIAATMDLDKMYKLCNKLINSDVYQDAMIEEFHNGKSMAFDYQWMYDTNQ